MNASQHKHLLLFFWKTSAEGSPCNEREGEVVPRWCLSIRDGSLLTGCGLLAHLLNCSLSRQMVSGPLVSKRDLGFLRLLHRCGWAA